MRPLRVLLILLLIGGGLAASAVFVSKAARSLHGSPLFHTSNSSVTDHHPGRPADWRTHTLEAGARARTTCPSAGRRRSTWLDERSAPRPAPARNRHHAGGLMHLGWVKLVLVVALEIAAGLLLVGALLLALVVSPSADAQPA